MRIVITILTITIAVLLAILLIALVWGLFNWRDSMHLNDENKKLRDKIFELNKTIGLQKIELEFYKTTRNN